METMNEGGNENRKYRRDNWRRGRRMRGRGGGDVEEEDEETDGE
jgi:hypothetical protein